MIRNLFEKKFSKFWNLESTAKCQIPRFDPRFVGPKASDSTNWANQQDLEIIRNPFGYII